MFPRNWHSFANISASTPPCRKRRKAFVARRVLFRLAGFAFLLLSAGSSTGQPAQAQVTALTYNVLAHSPSLFDDLSSFVLDRPSMTERTEATLDWIAIADSDIVALQEVTPALLSALKSDDRFANQHIATTLTDEELSASSWWLRSLHYLFGYQPWGQVILSHWPIQEVHVHPLGRPFLVADIEVDAVMLRVANCHLNSFAENHEKRTGQLEQIFRLLGSAPDVLLMGDFNFGDGSAEQAGLPTSYIDVWPRLHPDDPGYTFDPARNPLAAEGEISARIDRILLRSEHLLPLRVQLLSSSLRGPKASSDHFPVRAEFERKHAD